jgi:type II secretory pathway component GspD/PulD (secretin)
MILRMYREDRYSKFQQEPSLSVIDGTPATIFVGREIRYAEESVTTGTAGAAPVSSIKEATNSPVNTGFTLFIIPKIVRNEDKVIMTIIPQFDRLSGTSSATNPGFNTFATQGGAITRTIDLPQIDKSTLVTRLVMQSGTTVILGGLNEFTDTRNDQKLPFLGDIPVLGWLFKGSQQTQVATHLMIFLTPHVVRQADRARTMVADWSRARGAEDAKQHEGYRAPETVEEWQRQQDEQRRKMIEERAKMKEGAKGH